MKLKIKLLKGRIIYILYCLFMLLLAFMLDRFLQMLMFILLFEFVQNCFPKRFHTDTIIDNPSKAVKYCKIVTFVIEIIYLIYCKELSMSLYSNLFVIFIIALLNCLLQHFLEIAIVKKETFSDLNKLLDLCKVAKLSDLAINRMVLHYVEKKTYREIAFNEKVEEETIKKSIKRSRNAIKNCVN